MTPWNSSPWNLSWVNGSLACPRTTLGETSFLTFLLSWRIIYMSNKTLARLEPAKAAGSPFFDSRVTFLAGPASLHINFLAQPTRSTRSRRDNQSMRERFWQGNGVNLFFSYKRSLWEWPSPETSFLHLNGDFDIFSRHVRINYMACMH